MTDNTIEQTGVATEEINTAVIEVPVAEVAPMPAIPVEVKPPTHLICKSGVVPLIILPPDQEVPNEFIGEKGTYFIQQGENLLLLKNQPIHSYISKVEPDRKSKILQEFGKPAYDPTLVHLPRSEWLTFTIDINIFREVMRYFQAIYDEHQSEAAVLLLLNQKTKEWKILYVVQVSAAGGSVIYAQPIREANGTEDWNKKRVIEAIDKDKVASKRHSAVCDYYETLLAEGFRIFGTIHSHCNFSAFHSSVDDHDENDFDGLHITVGKVRSGWDYSCRYMVQGASFKVNIKEVLGVKSLDDVEKDVDKIEVPESLMDLMMPKLLRPQHFAVKPTGTWVGQPGLPTTNYNNKPVTTPYNQNPKVVEPSFWDSNDFTNWNSNSNTGGQDWDKNVFVESNMERLFDWHSGEVVLVKWSYYYENRSLFNHHEKLLTSEFPSSKMYTKHNAYKASQKDEKVNTKATNLLTQNVNDEKAHILNVPQVNPKHKKTGPKFGLGWKFNRKDKKKNKKGR